MKNFLNIEGLIWLIAASISLSAVSCSGNEDVDVLVAGGGTSGTAAAIQAARMGAVTVVVEEYGWLGGMLTSAGVSAVDGNYNLQGGIWREFKDSLTAFYGADTLLRTGWVSNVMFEPSVGKRIFTHMAEAEPMLDVLYNAVVTGVSKYRRGWKVEVKVKAKAEVEYKTVVYRTKVLIDATELGDISAMCGVPYDVGMDSRDVTGETIAPAQANDIIQDLTYVAVLKDYGHDVSIGMPEGYDPTLYQCCCINSGCAGPDGKNRLWPCESMMGYGRLPNNKYMINWPMQGNDYYLNLIEMCREERALALKAAKNHTLGFLYFMQHELGLNTLGLADNEYPTPDRLPFIPYHRESRRIHGKVRFTINHITHPFDQPEKLYRTAVAVGDYPVDHHHGRYTGPDTLPDLHFYPIPSYGLPLGVMIPVEVKDLIVAEKSISVTNIVNGTTRLQPVVLQIGQAAGVLAALAVKNKMGVSDVPVRDVQHTLLDAGCYLLPYLDVSPDHPWFIPMQRIGVTGIMKSVGKNFGWSNQTFFRATDTLFLSELEGLTELYNTEGIEFTHTPLTVVQAVDMIIKVAGDNRTDAFIGKVPDALKLIEAEEINGGQDRLVTRGEMAVLIDALLDPFNARKVDITGAFLR